MKNALQIILRIAIILAAAAVVSFGGQTLIHSTFGQSLTGMPSGFQQGGPPAGEQAEGQSSDSAQSAQASTGTASASTGTASTTGQGMQRGGRGGGGRGGGNAIMELGKNLAIVLVITAIGGLITTVAQRFLRRRGKPTLARVDD